MEGIRPVLPLIRNTPYGKRIQNKLQREQVDGFNTSFHGQQSVANIALRNASLAMGGHGNHISHQGLHAGNNETYGAPYSIQTGLQGQAGLSQAHLHGSLHNIPAHSIDNYVLQNNSNHSPGMTPPHTHAGFAAASSYGSGFPSMAVANGMGDPYQRGYGYGM